GTEQAIPLLRQALQTMPKNDRTFPMKTLTDAAVRTGDVSLAKKCAALEITRNNGNTGGWPRRVAILGAMATHFGHLPLAEHFLQQSVRYHQRADDLEGAGAVINDLGIAQLEQAKRRLAIRNFRHGMDIAHRLKNRVLLAHSAHNLGEAYRRAGDLLLSRRYLTEARRAAQSIGDLDGEAQTLHSLGLVEVGLGQLDAANAFFAELARVGTRLRSQFHRGQAAIGAGDVAFARDDHALAFRMYSEARRYFDRGKCESQMRVALYDMGLASRKLGRFKQASRLMMKSGTLSSAASDHSMLSTAMQGLAYLTTEHGTVAQTAGLLAMALLSALVSDDRAESYPIALASYRDILRMLREKKKTTPQVFRREVLGHFHGKTNTVFAEVIGKQLRAVSRGKESEAKTK
ncbi:MAG: tetratricopeptide repeat protein, partial [Phycisphaerae bacterium]